MLALRAINVKRLIPTRNAWTMYNKGTLITTTTITKVTKACYVQGQRGKWPAIAMQNSNSDNNNLLHQWQSQHYRNFSKKKVLKLPHMINAQKYQLCMLSPPAQKPLIVEAALSSKNIHSSNSNDCESTTKNQPIVDTPSPSKSTSTARSSPPPSPPPCTPPSSKSSNSDHTKSTDNVQLPEIKLPSREQVEKYFFRAVIIIWDLTVYLYAVAMKLIDQYILQNPTFKKYWNIFMQKLDNARKEMKK